MDYSFFSPPTQPYFMGMQNDGFAHGVDPETIRSIVSIRAGMSDVYPASLRSFAAASLLQEPFESSFLAGPYDAFSFSNALPTTNSSPDPAIATTPMHVGSLDSGIGGEVEDSRTSRTRSSSEEKESAMTPAQSRRKAQNRAAYVPCSAMLGEEPAEADSSCADSAPSASAKSAMYVTSRPN